MTAQTPTLLKTYFEAGDRPNQQQFADLIDSFINVVVGTSQNIAGNINVSGNVNIAGNLVVSAATSVQNLNVGGTLTVSAASTFGNLAIAGNGSVTGTFIVSGVSNLAGGGTTITVSAADNSTNIASTAQVQSAILNSFSSASNFNATLLFNGSAGGVVYASQIGKFIQIGKVVHAEYQITLTSKGTATGAMTIPNLPVTANNVGAGIVVYYTNMTGLTGQLVSYVNGTTANLSIAGSAGVAAVNDTNFTNSTQLNITFTYLAA